MRIVVAPDKFKGSLSAPEAAAAIAEGVRRAVPEAEIREVPMADGGEGTVDALVAATGGRVEASIVSGPLHEPVEARFGRLPDGTAVIEMAAASGLYLLRPDQRDPFRTTTFGTGELLAAAARAGARRLIVGIGGSATNDGGAGLAQALGFRLLDETGDEIREGGAAAAGRVAHIEPPAEHPLAGVRVDVASDVDNPLIGSRGASAVFGPQKFDPAHPATPEQIAALDEALRSFGAIIERDLGIRVVDLPGAGAAGGLGAGLVAFAGGRLIRGVELVIDAVGLRDKLTGAALCLTGEGAIDASTAGGKTPVGVAQAAQAQGVPTIALAGSIGKGASAVLKHGIDAYFSICRSPMSLADCIAAARPLLVEAAEHAVRAFCAGSGRARP